jgi:hypothetical protein
LKEVQQLLGFVSSIERTRNNNIAIALSTTPASSFLLKPQTFVCHNLCLYNRPPTHFKSLLGLALNYCIRSKYTTSLKELQQMDERFRKDLYTKSIFAGIPSTWTPDQLYVKSDNWEPPNELIEMSLKARTSYFLRRLKQSFRSRRVSSNLSPIQLHTLSILEKSKDFIVCPTDKNLGPCILEREQYIQQVFSLLNGKDTYLRLSEFDANCFQTQLQGKLQAWFQKYIWIISSERTSNSSNKSLDQLCAHFILCLRFTNLLGSLAQLSPMPGASSMD